MLGHILLQSSNRKVLSVASSTVTTPAYCWKPTCGCPGNLRILSSIEDAATALDIWKHGV